MALNTWRRGACALIMLGIGATAWPASLPQGFSEVRVASGIQSASAMAMAPDGRIFVCEQTGAVRVVKDGTLLPAPFVQLSVDSRGERGLLGIAFDPGFAANRFVYLHYTTSSSPVHNRISRFTANGDVAVPGSETVILELDDLSGATNHNGGAIHFGPDGKLYAAVGENANGANAQTLSNLLGKILRLNPDGSIPADNPFFATAGGRNRAIWALGLRNPFTFAFHRMSGRLFINDVGAGLWEEIDDGVAGANYGWPQTEGPQPAGLPGVRYPVHAYQHDAGCAISGGAFYDTRQQFPATYRDDYFFADLCGGWIRRMELPSGAVSEFASGIAQPVDLLVGPDGTLYYLSRGSGSVMRVLSDSAPARTLPSWHDSFAVHPAETPAVGDFNGDGRTDVVTFTRGNPLAVGDVYVALSDGTRFGAASKWHDWFAISADEQVVIGDYDGDGRDDIATWLAASTRQVYVARSLGTGMSPETVWSAGIGWAPGDVLAAGDANGDGRDDLVLFARSQGRVFVALSDGGSFQPPSLWHGFFAVSTAERPQVADVDGDGRSDIVTFASDSPTAFGDVYVARSDGSRFVDPSGAPDMSTKWHDFFAIRQSEQVRIADANGDGRDDFFTFLPLPWGQSYTALSRGDSMGESTLWPAGAVTADAADRPFAGDVNGDGHADIIVFAQAEGRVYVSLATP